MIEILKFIDDLKEIRDSMPYNNLTKSLVDDKIKKYEKEVAEFETWADEESKKEPMIVTGLMSQGT